MLTTAGWVVSGHLAEVGVVLDCIQIVSIRPVSRLRSVPGGSRSWGWASLRVGYVRLARKNSPEMFRASVRTTTIFWPLSSCLATMLARRPRRWPLPSMTTCGRQKQSVSRTVGWFVCREAVPAAQYSMVRRIVVCSCSCCAVFQPPESTSFACRSPVMHCSQFHRVHHRLFPCPRRHLATS